MSRGLSGRLVIEIDPQMKRRLYSALAAEGVTLKSWFLSATNEYLRSGPAPPAPSQKTKSKARS